MLSSTKILVLAVVGGIPVGALGGWLISLLIRLAREPIVVMQFSCLPFVVYEASEKIGGSGPLSVVICGVWIAHTTSVRRELPIAAAGRFRLGPYYLHP